MDKKWCAAPQSKNTLLTNKHHRNSDVVLAPLEKQTIKIYSESYDKDLDKLSFIYVPKNRYPENGLCFRSLCRSCFLLLRSRTIGVQLRLRLPHLSSGTFSLISSIEDAMVT